MNGATRFSRPLLAAEITVFRGRRGWMVRFNAREYGPHASRSAAAAAAIDAARLAGRLGHAVTVRAVVGPARSQLLWPRQGRDLRHASAA